MALPINVKFLNIQEIRMGSPYSVCSISLTGDWVPDIPKDDWQNLSAYNPEGTILALVRWDVIANTPGFRIYQLDTVTKSVKISDYIPGLCKKLEWGPDGIDYEAI